MQANSTTATPMRTCESKQYYRSTVTPEGRVKEHRRIASLALGRPLKVSEVVHHIDGDPSNNAPGNLMVFISNAHHLRFHGGAMAVRRKDGAYHTRTKMHSCPICQSRCSTTLDYCSTKCSRLASRKVARPTEQELTILLGECTWTEIGRRYGVSDNAVRKWMRQYDREAEDI